MNGSRDKFYSKFEVHGGKPSPYGVFISPPFQTACEDNLVFPCDDSYK
jgi:hypothetical protein